MIIMIIVDILIIIIIWKRVAIFFSVTMIIILNCDLFLNKSCEDGDVDDDDDHVKYDGIEVWSVIQSQSVRNNIKHKYIYRSAYWYIPCSHHISYHVSIYYYTLVALMTAASSGTATTVAVFVVCCDELCWIRLKAGLFSKILSISSIRGRVSFGRIWS